MSRLGLEDFDRDSSSGPYPHKLDQKRAKADKKRKTSIFQSSRNLQKRNTLIDKTSKFNVLTVEEQRAMRN